MSFYVYICERGNETSALLPSYRNSRLMLYNTIILPLFDYCSPVWDSCGAGSKDYVDKL